MQQRLVDPRNRFASPPFRGQGEIEPPGTETEMTPQPDHGETTYEGSGKLQGRKALITGGDSGIGRAIAIAYAREGADIVIAYLSETEREDAMDTAALVKDAGQKCILIEGDLTDEQHCKQVIDQTLEELGGLDILVNNAAYQMSFENLEDIPTEAFDRTFKTNIYAPFWLCKAALPHLQPGSSIINTASINSYEPLPILLPYATTKGAIANFTQGLAKLLADKGIRVNAVAPGPVWTPLIPSTMPEPHNFGKDSPFGRPAQPAELAPVYVLLASNEASYITGMIYGVTGGKLLP